MKFLLNFWDGFCVNDPKCSFIASHLHYNNISCILDVCLLCCNVVCWWVWIGLSLWWFLSLHVICSCIFMHMYLQFLIFFYIVLLVLFWLSFYLLLSLSCVSLLYGTQTQVENEVLNNWIHAYWSRTPVWSRKDKWLGHHTVTPNPYCRWQWEGQYRRNLIKWLGVPNECLVEKFSEKSLRAFLSQNWRW